MYICIKIHLSLYTVLFLKDDYKRDFVWEFGWRGGEDLRGGKYEENREIFQKV